MTDDDELNERTSLLPRVRPGMHDEHSSSKLLDVSVLTDDDVSVLLSARRRTLQSLANAMVGVAVLVALGFVLWPHALAHQSNTTTPSLRSSVPNSNAPPEAPSLYPARTEIAGAFLDQQFDQWDAWKDWSDRQVHAAWDTAVSTEQALQQQAKLEWDNLDTRTTALEWWDDTKEIVSTAADKSKEWVSTAAQKSKSGTKIAWNATSHGAQKGWNAIPQEAQVGWNATSQGAEALWNSTSHEAEHVWNRTTQVAQATPEWLGATHESVQHNLDAAAHSTEHWASQAADTSSGWLSTAESGLETAWDKTKNVTETAWDKTEAGAEAAWKATANHASSWWNDATTWTEEASNETQQAAHHFWNDMTNDERAVSDRSHQWWNYTVADREEWQNQTLYHVHHFGHRVKSWWRSTEHYTHDKIKVMQHAFQQWYHFAHDREKRWWNHTVLAYHHFAHATHNKTSLWWDWAKLTTENTYNMTKREEEQWWNTTQQWFAAHATYEQELSTPLLYLNHSRSFSLMFNDYGYFDYSPNFFLLQPDVQINQGYCAVATAAAVLNSFRGVLHLPTDPMYDPYPYATQTNMMMSDCANEHVIRHNASYNGISHAPGGLSLAQTGRLLACFLPHDVEISVHHVDPTNVTIDAVRQDLQTSLQDVTARVLVNFDRTLMGQDGYGHFSPLGSYSPSNDAFLIVDVAKYKYPPFWVTAAKLYAAMSTVDLCGSWNYPAGQDDITWSFTNHSSSRKSYYKALDRLHCRSMFRGYIVVRQSNRQES